MANAQIAQQVIGEQLLKAAQVAEEQVDKEIQRLETLDDDDLERLRQKRVEHMKQAQKQRNDWQQNGHGEYTEMADEREFFDATKKSRRVVCHFYRDGAERCKILDMHLRKLAATHLETRFITANVERVPFLVERLNIRVIPTMACIIDSNTETYIRGFEGVSDRDDFATELLERRLGATNVITLKDELPAKKSGSSGTKISIVRGVKKNIRGNDTDSDEDW